MCIYHLNLNHITYNCSTLYIFSIAKFTDGVIVPVKKHDAIPLEDVQWLAEFMNGESKVPFVNALSMLRRKHFPFFYDPHPWVAGKLLNINCQFVIQNLYLF